MRDFTAVWKNKVAEVEGILERSLPGVSQQPALLHEAMRYSTLQGGKRLRALLVLGSCEAVGGDPDQTHGLMAALEMIHAYSLIHDDLPCMDDDELRRGKPTNHRVYGEALAILAGDGLLTEAFAELARMPENYNVSRETALQIIKEVAESSGSRGLVGGQAVDILSQGQKLDPALLEYIHSHKTGSLIQAALRGGALIGGATAVQLDSITAYAKSFGLAFQITDDILDETGDPVQLGKATGSDRRLAKLTFPRLYGLDGSKEMAQACLEKCLEALDGFSETAWLLRELAAFIIRRGF